MRPKSETDGGHTMFLLLLYLRPKVRDRSSGSNAFQNKLRLVRPVAEMGLARKAYKGVP